MRDTRVSAEEGSTPGDDEKNTILKTYEPAMKGVVRMINTTIIHGFINEPTYENYLSERFPLPEAYIRRFQTAGGAPPPKDPARAARASMADPGGGDPAARRPPRRARRTRSGEERTSPGEEGRRRLP